jgi:exo-beta-1,3-glucanase (GH17 family)
MDIYQWKSYGKDLTTLSNLTVTTSISTNEYHPEVALLSDIITVDSMGKWEVRTAPDVNTKIVETHKIKTLTCTCEGKSFAVVLADEVTDRKMYDREVKTEETWKERK